MPQKGIAIDVIKFQVNRRFISMAKFFIITLEELEEEGLISKEAFIKLRKQVLDMNGDSIRELESLLDQI